MSEGDSEQIFVLSNVKSEYFSKSFRNELVKSMPRARELKIKRKDFPGFPTGERYVRIDVENKPLALFGRDCVVVASLLNDDDFLEFFRVAYTLANLGSRSRIFIVPFLASFESSSEYISQIKPNAQLFSALTTYGLGNSFLFMDLHIPGFLHYLEGSSLHVELLGYKTLNKEMKRHSNFFEGDFVFVAPDLGRPKIVAEFAKDHHKDLAFIHRFEKTSDEYGEVIGEVSGKHTIIYDDLIRTGQTLIQGAALLLRKNALSVKAIVSHLCGEVDIIQKLLNSQIQHFVISNSTIYSQHPLIAEHPERFTVVDVAPLFVDAVHNILQPNILIPPLSPSPSSAFFGGNPFISRVSPFGIGTGTGSGVVTPPAGDCPGVRGVSPIGEGAGAGAGGGGGGGGGISGSE